MDVAVGIGATGLVCACWWLVKRSLAAAKRALHEAYRGASPLERQKERYLPPGSLPTPRDAKGTPVVRDMAARAGRFVGSVQRAYRDGRSEDG